MAAAADTPGRLAGWSVLGPLALARAVDQGVLGLATLVLAARYGPSDFAPLALLFLVNSLGVQISDFGLGYRVLRAAPDERLDRRGLRRVRLANGGLAIAAAAVGLAVGGPTGQVVAGAGAVWAASAEAYVRKAGVLKSSGARRVAGAEVAGALVVAAGSAGLWVTEAGAIWLAGLFVAKHALESAATSGGLSWFVEGGGPFGSRDEWVGQVLTYATANVDFLAVGLLVDPAALSVYLVGFRVASALPALLSVPINQTAFVTFARLEPGAAPAAIRPLVVRVFGLGLAAAVVALVAAGVLPPVMGDEWEGSGPVIALLAVATPWRLLLSGTVAAALVAGGAAAVVRWEAARLALTATAVFVAASQGIEPVAAAVSWCLLGAVTWQHAATCRLLGSEPVGAVAWAAAAGALAVAVVLVVV